METTTRVILRFSGSRAFNTERRSTLANDHMWIELQAIPRKGEIVLMSDPMSDRLTFPWWIEGPNTYKGQARDLWDWAIKKVTGHCLGWEVHSVSYCGTKTYLDMVIDQNDVSYISTNDLESDYITSGNHIVNSLIEKTTEREN